VSKQTHYDVLGVSRSATPAEIRRAYRRLARGCHPDAVPGADPAAFRSVCEAYALLSDETQRRSYDRQLEAPPAPMRPERASFGDEIAIDFPSVSALVDRVWHAFADQSERPRPLFAEIELTSTEARDGIRVPLAVPLRAICPRCGGRGEIWLEVCGRCAGLGECTVRHQVTVSLPPGMTGGERLAFTLRSARVPVTPVELRIAVRP
jgi:molecular chaperone DnaJ